MISKLRELKEEQKKESTRFGWTCKEIEILKFCLNNIKEFYLNGLILESEIEKLKEKYKQEIKSLELDLYSLDY